MCVRPLKVFHNNQRCNQRWNEKKRQRGEKERLIFYLLDGYNRTLMFHRGKAEVHVWLPGQISDAAVTADALQSRCIFEHYVNGDNAALDGFDLH